jgi:spore coat protein CotH
LKTNQWRTDFSDLIGLMRQVADTEQPISEVLDVDRMLRLLAVNSWLANMDSHPGTGDNMYLYHTASDRFGPVPWDLNQAFGAYGSWSCVETTDDLLNLDPDDPTCGGPRPMVERLLGQDGYKERYHEILGELVDGVLYPDAVLQRMEWMRELIRDLALQDNLDEFTDEEFDAAFIKDIPEGDNPERVPGLEPFIRARDRRVREVLGGE